MNRRFVSLALATILVAGCTSYYKVTDPTTGRVYYTTELEQQRQGSAQFEDARTGNMVTLQNSEVEEIEKEEYEAGKYTAPTAARPAAPSTAAAQ